MESLCNCKKNTFLLEFSEPILVPSSAANDIQDGEVCQGEEGERGRERRGRGREGGGGRGSPKGRKDPVKGGPPPSRPSASDPLGDSHGMEDRVPLRRFDVNPVVFIEAVSWATVMGPYF